MFYKFISLFLIFTILNIIFEIDLQLVLILLGLILMSYIIFLNFYRAFLNDIYKMSNMSFIILMSFIMSYILIYINDERGGKFHLQSKYYEINAKIINVSLKDNVKTVSLEVQSLTDLAKNTAINKYPKYLEIKVSPIQEYNLFDQLNIIGEINMNKSFSNSKSFKLNDNEIIGGKEKLFFNSNYRVSNIKNIQVTQSEFKEKKKIEQIKILFYETSNLIKNKIDLHIKDPYLGVAKGITYGAQENIIKDIKDKFINSGLIHIMVLSGANVSFIILLFFFLLQKINLKFRIYFTILMSTLFIFATGLTAPSVRAGVMVNIALLSEYYSKNFSIKKSILLSLFILTLINPFALVYSASLHLSYLAIFGLVFVTPKIYKLINKFITTTPSKFFQNFATPPYKGGDSRFHISTNNSEIIIQKKSEIENSNYEINLLLSIFKNNFWKGLMATFLGITISVGPYLLAMSSKINLLGTVASIILEPIILIVTVLTFLITLISFFSTFLASILGVINSFFISIILNTADFLSNDIFILNVQIDSDYVLIYYLLFIIYFFVLNRD